MIINGFGGGVADSLGLKVVQPGTVLYNNGFASGFSIGDSIFSVSAYGGTPSGTWLVTKGYGIVAALIKQPIYLTPLRGKTILIDWFNATANNANYRLAFGVLPYNTATIWNPVNAQAGVSSNFQGAPVIGTPYVTPTDINAYTVYTASIDITDDMVFGYIGMSVAISTTTDRGYMGANNIRISS